MLRPPDHRRIKPQHTKSAGIHELLSCASCAASIPASRHIVLNCLSSNSYLGSAHSGKLGQVAWRQMIDQIIQQKRLPILLLPIQLTRTSKWPSLILWSNPKFNALYTTRPGTFRYRTARQTGVKSIAADLLGSRVDHLGRLVDSLCPALDGSADLHWPLVRNHLGFLLLAVLLDFVGSPFTALHDPCINKARVTTQSCYFPQPHWFIITP